VNPWNNGERGWGFSCRIGDAFGRPMTEGIRIALPEGTPDPAGEKAKTAQPYTVIDTRQFSNRLPGYGGAAMVDGVKSVHRWTLPETGWSKAFYLRPWDRAWYTEDNQPLWKYPATLTDGGITFTAHDVSEAGWRQDSSNLLWMTDAFGRPICRSFFLSGWMSPDGAYSPTPVATIRFTGDKGKRYRLAVTGVSHVSAGGSQPFPDVPMKIAVVPAGTRPSDAPHKAEATFRLPHGGNYLDYATLETVIDGDCDIYLVGIHANPNQIVSLFGAFLDPQM
ncbi:MAG: hypothetical protein FWF84_03960, partial [Kiritimatiellaeota bacterium]|nr:hypothetical protein [Kiritimatiellota bacterium]